MASMTSPTSTAQPDQVVIGGIDTHKDTHVAALLDRDGSLLGSASFPTTQAGYRQLQAWMHRAGTLARVGVEGTGSYGAGICRQLSSAGIEVVEVNRPDRSQRRCRQVVLRCVDQTGLDQDVTIGRLLDAADSLVIGTLDRPPLLDAVNVICRHDPPIQHVACRIMDQ